jgi:predicted phosphoribosyltransferase
MGSPFDVIVASFIRLGSNLAPVGAMAESAPAEMDPEFQPGMGLLDSLQAAIDESRARVRQDLVLYRTLRPVKDLRGRRVIIVDAVVVFPWRMLAAARVAEGMGASGVVMAAPVVSQLAADRLRARLYEVVSPAVLPDADTKGRYFGESGGDAPERLRAIMIAHQAA